MSFKYNVIKIDVCIAFALFKWSNKTRTVWRNFDENWNFRGDLNIEVWLKLGFKNWFTRAADHPRYQMLPTLWFNPIYAEYKAILFFRLHSLSDHTGLEQSHNFEKLTKFSIFSKFKHLKNSSKMLKFFKVLQNSEFLVEFYASWCLYSIRSFWVIV